MRTSPAPGGPHRGRLRASAGLLVAFALVAPSAAQEPPSPAVRPPIGGSTSRLPMPPEVREVPAPGPFVTGVGAPTSAIEVKVGQGRFLNLRQNLAVAGQQAPFLAVGDPSVADFFQVRPNQIRLIGKKIGTTDLSITTGSGDTYDYEVRVVADLETLRAELAQAFPDASLQVSQVRERLIVGGQARDATQVSRIISMINGYIRSTQAIQVGGQIGDVRNLAQAANAEATPPIPRPPDGGEALPQLPGPAAVATGFAGPAGGALPSPGAIAANQIATDQVQVVNLIRVPTSQQVMLKVRVAELNRTAFRQIGADFLARIPQFGDLFGTQIGGSTFIGSGSAGTTASVGQLAVTNQSTLYGTFSKGNFSVVLSALRRNNLLKILAEPNLITLNGHQANFLAGGEFPVPVLSGSGGGGGSNINIQFKEFGVRLAFLPIIQDGDTIRLTVDPEVSTIDFTVGTTLVPGGSPVPGLNTRKSHSTVELKSGDTLAIAGLMQLSLGGSTQRIPGLGDLPYIGPFFSNTTSNRIEKELVVTVTPYIVEPMGPGQVAALPGEEVREPNDLEFFLLNRIEGRTGIDKRSTTSYDDPFHLIRQPIVEKKYLIGPSGYSR